MAVDIAFLCVNDVGWSEDVLCCRPDSELLTALNEMPTQYCHKSFKAIGAYIIDTQQGFIDPQMQDAYRKSLKYTTVWELSKLKIPARIKAYLSKLPHNQRVVLYWH